MTINVEILSIEKLLFEKPQHENKYRFESNSTVLFVRTTPHDL